jgi:tetratricopeptide (TPR) repeat protein
MGEFNEALKHVQTARQVLALGPLTSPAGTNGEPRPALPGVTLEVEREAWTIELAMAQVLVEMRDQNQRARDQAEQVLRGLDRRRHPELAAETLNLLGRLARLQSDLEQATQLVRESLALYQAYGNRSGAAAAYANLGVLAANKREMETAYSHFALSLGLREALGDSLGIAISRNNLGQLERNRGRFTEAIQQLSRAADRARHAEAAPLLAQTLSNLGQAQTLAGQHEAALASFDEADMVSRGYGLKNTLCEVAWKRADCLAEMGNLEGAEQAAQTALGLARELTYTDLRSETQRALARVMRLRGQTQAALEHAEAAWQARARDGNAIVRGRFAAEYALALLAAEPGRAAAAHALLEAHVSDVQLPESAFTLGEIAAAMAQV